MFFLQSKPPTVYFNPRPREEGDEKQMGFIYNHDISIHALVKRATEHTQIITTGKNDFNPRPREEGDHHLYLSCIRQRQFQSTPS